MQTIEPYETELVKKIVQKDWVCLDIGANEGYYTVLLAGLCKFVHAFEAEPRNYAKLEYNVRYCQNVKTKCAIVSDRDGWAELYPCTGNYNGANGMHRIYKSKWCSDISIPIRSTSMDIFLSGKKKPDFIKMDVEGSEFGVIKGMHHILDIYHPQMLIEFHPPTLEEAGTKPQDVYDFLVKQGYEIELVWPNEPITNYEQLDKLTRNESGGQNIYCQ